MGIPVKKADLHVHSYYSDGTDSPAQLVEMAVAASLIGMSITDHDTVQGYKEAVLTAKERGLRLIPGIEVSTKFGSEQIHVLGYSFDVDHEAITDMCRIHHERRMDRNMQILEKLAALGYNLSMKEVQDISPHALSYGRPHIAVAMVQKGYASSFSSAFSTYLKSGGRCYVEGKKWTVEEAILRIHDAHGFAVLAHPHLMKDRSCTPSLLRLPFDGIEGYYDSFSFQENSFWIQMAERHKLFVTGGSDFHGSIKPDIRLGRSWAPFETFERLCRRSVVVH